jgi:hypothetical protein
LPLLRYHSQRAAVKDESYQFIQSFARFYTERKSLSAAMSDPNYCHKSVSGSIPLQPLKRLKQGAVYKVLAEEAAAVSKKQALSESKLILRVKKLNDTARLEECVEQLCKSLANIAESCLVIMQCRTVDRHSLVSTLLSNHWAAFRHLATYDRTNFVQLYKRANNVTTAFSVDSVTLPITPSLHPTQKPPPYTYSPESTTTDTTTTGLDHHPPHKPTRDDKPPEPNPTFVTTGKTNPSDPSLSKTDPSPTTLHPDLHPTKPHTNQSMLNHVVNLTAAEHTATTTTLNASDSLSTLIAQSPPSNLFKKAQLKWATNFVSALSILRAQKKTTPTAPATPTSPPRNSNHPFD